MATFVLVHGAWRGADGFRLVRSRLQAAGHTVFTPSLTGLGERSHLASPQVNLSTHVQDVVNAILYEDLDRVVLLGFSYGGFVVTGALPYVGERVDHLVYLDAFLPGDGESLFGQTGGQTERALGLGDRWLVPPPGRDHDDAAEAKFSAQRRGPHPVGCFTEPVRVPKPLESYGFTRTYIKATKEPRDGGGPAAIWRAAERVRSSPAWRYREIATNHMIPSNRPAELVGLLEELVSEP